ncbi:hypothetical protein CASFOL_023826 [Castilleja foliolosa]|uniref:LAZY1 n=1 Tax=Castilleja foliolosa TaxID=1961234 RepID=A0ABD3CQI0_9LAMI
MKFLGWMHRKLTQNCTDPNKNSTIGNLTSYDKQNSNKEPAKTLKDLNVKCQKPSIRSEANNADVIFQEELFEPFDFLAIGTFGMELLNTDPPTPTLPTPFENLTNPSEITENDFMFINYELEKFLEAEEKENANDISGRSSQASIITLSYKPTEGANSEGHVYTMACPLQNYLFATSIEQTETDEVVKKEKESFEGFIKRSNMAHHDGSTKICEAEKQPRKRNATHFMKKVVKKFNSSSSLSKTSSKNDADVTISIKKKLSKAVRMFHRKVHAEEMTDKQFKLQKSEKKDIFHENDRQIRGYNENKMVGHGGSKWSEKSTIKLSSNGTNGHVSTINEGHWIKTDSDCKLGLGAVGDALEAKTSSLIVFGF